MAPKRKRVELSAGDVLVYNGVELDQDVLDAIVSTDRRLLWAFVAGPNGDIRALAYSENEVIWMTPEDVVKPEEVEL